MNSRKHASELQINEMPKVRFAGTKVSREVEG